MTDAKAGEAMAPGFVRRWFAAHPDDELTKAYRAIEAELAAARKQLSSGAHHHGPFDDPLVHLRDSTARAIQVKADRAEALSRKLAEATKALRAAKEAMDRYDPRDCPHSSPKGMWDTRAQGLVDAFLSSDPAPSSPNPGVVVPGTWAFLPPQREAVVGSAVKCDSCGGWMRRGTKHDCRNRRVSAESDRAECEG